MGSIEYGCIYILYILIYSIEVYTRLGFSSYSWSYSSFCFAFWLDYGVSPNHFNNVVKSYLY